MLLFCDVVVVVLLCIVSSYTNKVQKVKIKITVYTQLL
jgi:hypothetical protein